MSRLTKRCIDLLRKAGVNTGKMYTLSKSRMGYVSSSSISGDVLTGYCKLRDGYVVFISDSYFGGHDGNLGSEFDGHCWYTTGNNLTEFKNKNKVGW